MYRIVSAAAVIAFLTSPAMAWDNTNMGNGQIVDQGGAGAISHARANASNNVRTSNQATNSISGVTGGAGGNAAGGTGYGGTGYGGAAQGGSASATGGSVTVNGGSGSSGPTRAPDIGLPSIAGGGFDCPVVGIGGGGSGLAGGGGGLLTWLSTDCNARKLAEILWSMGQREQAIAVLRHHFPEVDDAFNRTATSHAAFVPSPWCAHASAIERKRNPASCGG